MVFHDLTVHARPALAAPHDGDHPVIDRAEPHLVRRALEMKGGRVLLDDQDAVQVPYVLRDAEPSSGCALSGRCVVSNTDICACHAANCWSVGRLDVSKRSGTKAGLAVSPSPSGACDTRGHRLRSTNCDPL